jgi:cytochrome c biogenesis protein ResB
LSKRSTPLRPSTNGGKTGRAVDKIWLFFSSVKLTIVLLILLAGVMSYGTYVETALSNGAARILVYKTWWFDTLLALVALNLIGCTLRRAPYKPHQAGWITTHIALLILMAGSVVTHRFGIHGQMVVPEGESNNLFYLEELNRETLETVNGEPRTLPFSVYAISFEQILYPGISTTRMFRTQALAWEPGSTDTVRHDIVLNHPLVMDGYKISQASWIELGGGKQATVLGVAYDPGIPLMYVGSILLIVGMIGIFFVKPYLKQKFPPKPVQRAVALAEHTEMTAELEAKPPHILTTAKGVKTDAE